MDRVFEALASAARRKILAYLNEGELTAGEIGSRFDFSKPALSGHLRILEDAGLISREKRGQFVYFQLVPDRLANTVVSDFAPGAENGETEGSLGLGKFRQTSRHGSGCFSFLYIESSAFLADELLVR